MLKNNASKLDQSTAFIFDNYDVRGELVSLNEVIYQTNQHQKYPTAIASLLGEMLAAAALMRSMLKFNGNLLLQARSDSVIKLISAECNHNGALRGTVRFVAESLKSQTSDITELLDGGIFALTLDADLKHNYQSLIELNQPNLSACLMEFFAQSQQLPTCFVLLADNQQAYGLLLQQLPQNIESEYERIENFNKLSTIAQTITLKEFTEFSHQEILWRLFHEEQVRFFKPQKLFFSCSCSRAKALSVLANLPKNEIEQIFNEKEQIIINCEFCGNQQLFTAADLV